jgi:hypothetical protein
MDALGHSLTGVPITWVNFGANIVRLERMDDSVVVVPVVPGVARIVVSAGTSGATATVMVTVTSSLAEAFAPQPRRAIAALPR